MFVSTKQQQIAELARKHAEVSFTSLHHHIDYAWLFTAYQLTRKDGAVGVDRVTATMYEQNLESNLQDLLCRVKSGRYRAPAIRRVYIPKGDGKQRPLGIPTFEDKIVQRAVVMLLEPIYEQDFHPASFGFRPGRSAHQALQYVRDKIMEQRGQWILDVDIQKYFDTINHTYLRKFLDRRVRDGVIRRLIDKWLRAGILEGNQLTKPSQGTPQGGVISPLLANIYLHYVLDEWFECAVRPRMRGHCSLTRFADDFVMVFEDYRDCYRVQKVLGQRFIKYGLTLHPDKTRRVDFRFRYRKMNIQRGKVVNFDFLGFTHHWGKSRLGKFVVRQKTAKGRLAKALKAINLFCKVNRHRPLIEQWTRLNKRLIGHYAYFGITGNSKSIRGLHYKAQRLWHKWLGRRSRKSYIPWKRFALLLRRLPLAAPKIYHQYYMSHQAAKQ
ncbi:group II intron reverse transcriptase/maturase [Maribrevibacterium harenarium]|uniref:Group II intron reverse transcriptase/maturase n=1 Tax=Maribrevibacterium harenarium TaxID=2589817 RepID=A0A501W8P3_9GAMM|nr:group II intron reverse transcriptase/maturase [Maribrevibacterium harenarium]TPE45718.1 group II intron reverse transcriptase/maturase [Maribrevibacterium harenarium]